MLERLNWVVIGVSGGVVSVSSPRVRRLNDESVDDSGEVVLYWMTSTRRYHYNAAMDRAIELCQELGKPLLVVECISVRHEWSSERVLTFVVQGMVDNMSIFSDNGITYLPWIENHLDSGDGMLKKLSTKACACLLYTSPSPRDRG